MASLIYHAGALGDFITTLPAIARWRERYASQRQVLLGKPAHASLLLPFDEVWDVEKAEFSPLFAGGAVDGSPLDEKTRTITSALLFAAPSSPLATVLERRGVREVVRQNPFPASVVHVVDYHLSLFAPEDRGSQRVPRILLPPARQARGARDIAAIHSGSGSARKNWPRAKFVELAAGLVEHGMEVRWIIGPAEAAADPPPHGVTWDRLPLAVLAGRLAGCGLYVGNDSGVTHLAAAAGCRTVALFGESDPRVWAPRGPYVRIIEAGAQGLTTVESGDVLHVCLDFLKEK